MNGIARQMNRGSWTRKENFQAGEKKVSRTTNVRSYDIGGGQQRGCHRRSEEMPDDRSH
jgi:hypothetical protein